MGGGNGGGIVRGARRVGEEAREGGGEGRERGVAARGGGTVRAQHDGIRAGTQPSLRSERRDAFGDVSYETVDR